MRRTAKKNQWFRWKNADFEHAINLALVAQWLYFRGAGRVREHVFVWHAGCDDKVVFEGLVAREFRKAMRSFMGVTEKPKAKREPKGVR